MVGALFFHRLCDVLKSHQQLTEAPSAVMSCNRLGQRCRHQSFYDIVLWRKSAGRFSLAEQIIRQQRTHLIAAQGSESAACISHHHTQAVRIRIGCQNQLGRTTGLLDPVNHRVEDFEVFRIGSMLRHIWKVTIGRTVGFEDAHVLKSCRLNDRIHGCFTNAVQWRKDGTQVAAFGF